MFNAFSFDPRSRFLNQIVVISKSGNQFKLNNCWTDFSHQQDNLTLLYQCIRINNYTWVSYYKLKSLIFLLLFNTCLKRHFSIFYIGNETHFPVFTLPRPLNLSSHRKSSLFILERLVNFQYYTMKR